jgi:hypothetical protein
MPGVACRAARRFVRVVSVTGTVSGVVAVLSIATSGCAGKQRVDEAPPHPIGLEINNNLTVPTEITVYVTQDQGEQRLQVGTVPGAQTRTLSFTPVSWGQSYRLLAQRQLEGPLRSPPFTIPNAGVGTVGWSLVPNQIQLYDVAVDSTSKAPSR